MIEARGLTKRYGPALAVDGLSFTICPGLVTGFLGPNGAGAPRRSGPWLAPEGAAGRPDDFPAA